jgi:hypothetical protein
MSGVNPATFGKDTEFETQNGETLQPPVHRPYFFGNYDYENEAKDREYIDKALRSNKLVSYEQVLNGVRVTKTFLPIASTILEDALGPDTSKGELDTLDRYMLLFTGDEMYEPLRNQFTTLVAIIPASAY